MYCDRCNVDFPQGLRYCKWCGQRLSSRAAVTTHMQTCPTCTSPVKADWTFCKSCGGRLAATARQPEVFCPSCGVLIPPPGLKCPSCSLEVLGHEAAPKPAPQKPDVQLAYCAECGMRLDARAASCPNCGTSVARRIVSLDTNVSEALRFCPVCGAEAPAGADRCPACGDPMTQSTQSASGERELKAPSSDLAADPARRNSDTIPDFPAEVANRAHDLSPPAGVSGQPAESRSHVPGIGPAAGAPESLPGQPPSLSGETQVNGSPRQITEVLASFGGGDASGQGAADAPAGGPISPHDTAQPGAIQGQPSSEAGEPSPSTTTSSPSSPSSRPTPSPISWAQDTGPLSGAERTTVMEESPFALHETGPDSERAAENPAEHPAKVGGASPAPDSPAPSLPSRGAPVIAEALSGPPGDASPALGLPQPSTSVNEAAHSHEAFPPMSQEVRPGATADHQIQPPQFGATGEAASNPSWVWAEGQAGSGDLFSAPQGEPAQEPPPPNQGFQAGWQQPPQPMPDSQSGQPGHPEPAPGQWQPAPPYPGAPGGPPATGYPGPGGGQPMPGYPGVTGAHPEHPREHLSAAALERFGLPATEPFHPPAGPQPFPAPARPETQKKGGGARVLIALLIVGFLIVGSVVVVGAVLYIRKQRHLREEQARLVQQAAAPVAPAAPSVEPSVAPTPEVPPAAPDGMVYVPAGSYTVGRDDGDTYAKPAHKVDLEAFFIDTTEVTDSQYKQFVDATGHKAPENWTDGAIPEGQDDFPVTDVSWKDASEYAAWAGKRLPSEAEWEAAARGPDGRIYPWGNEWKPGMANIKTAAIVPVGAFKDGASPCGALDMIGNVWEWTADDFSLYAGNSGKPPESLAPAVTYKVIRGGAYDGGESNDATYRGFVDAAKGYPKTGFRCVKSVEK